MQSIREQEVKRQGPQVGPSPQGAGRPSLPPALPSPRLAVQRRFSLAVKAGAGGGRGTLSFVPFREPF